MIEDANSPDFDAMSQDEVIAWLETMAGRNRGESTQSAPDFDAELKRQDLQLLPEAQDLGEWSDWLDSDETLQQDRPTKSDSALPTEHEPDEDETPTAMTSFDDSGSDETTDPLTWSEERQSAPDSVRAASHKAGREADRPDAPAAAELEDPLEWLDSLANEVSEASEEFAPSLDAAAAQQNIDLPEQALDSKEGYVAGEDESLYSQPAAEATFPDALTDQGEPIDVEFGTQSMAPLPDFMAPAPAEPEPTDSNPPSEASHPSEANESSSRPVDALTQAFMLQDQQAELEAWYAERLRAIATADEPAHIGENGELEPLRATMSLKQPPPGLAAGFNSARGKLEAGKLDEALGDYETLLRANIGLDLVVGDLQWLLTQAPYQNKPAVHRVLGDALMRRDDLQQALDAYRQALRLL